MTTGGYGQQTPLDTTSPLNQIAFVVRQMIARMATTKLVQIKAVNGNGSIAAPGTVDVLPLVNQIDGIGNATPHGIVHGIPWARVQGGPNAIICDPQVGDIGFVVVSDRDISNVKANKKQSNPGSFRRYDLADGIYVGGCLNDAPTQYVAFLDIGIKIVDKNGNTVETKAGGMTLTDCNGNIIDMAAGLMTLTATRVKIDGILEVTHLETADAGLTVTGTVMATVDVVGGGHSLATHIHGGVTVGAGDTGTPIG